MGDFYNRNILYHRFIKYTKDSSYWEVLAFT